MMKSTGKNPWSRFLSKQKRLLPGFLLLAAGMVMLATRARGQPLQSHDV